MSEHTPGKHEKKMYAVPDQSDPPPIGMTGMFAYLSAHQARANGDIRVILILTEEKIGDPGNSRRRSIHEEVLSRTEAERLLLSLRNQADAQLQKVWGRSTPPGRHEAEVSEVTDFI